MMPKEEIIAWLQRLPPGIMVGIDEGGLTLQTEDESAYLEVGGIPLEDEEDTDDS